MALHSLPTRILCGLVSTNSLLTACAHTHISFYLSTVLQLYLLFWSSNVLSSLLPVPLYLLLTLSGLFSCGWLVPSVHPEIYSIVTSSESLITLSKAVPHKPPPYSLSYYRVYDSHCITTL